MFRSPFLLASMIMGSLKVGYGSTKVMLLLFPFNFAKLSYISYTGTKVYHDPFFGSITIPPSSSSMTISISSSSKSASSESHSYKGSMISAASMMVVSVSVTYLTVLSLPTD